MLNVLRILTALIALAQIYLFRFRLFQEDAVSYLDLSDYAMSGRWIELCNAHFCPLYPVLIAVARTLLPVPLTYEPLLLKVVNLVCFAGSWLAFEYLLKVAFPKPNPQDTTAHSAKRQRTHNTTVAVVYCGFMYGTLCLSGLYQDTPDYLTNAALFYSTALVLQLRKEGSTLKFALLGVVLGLGFLAKTIAFYFGLIFIATLSILVRNQQAAVPRMLALITAFAIVCAPFIITLSRTAGHLTLGDSGKLCWVASMCRLGDVHARTPDFTHPSRIIYPLPPTYEFGGHDDSTYSPFLNQSYWYDGASILAPDLLNNVMEVFGMNVLVFLKHGLAALFLSWALFWVLARENFLCSARLRENWFLFAVPVLGLVMYAIVYPMQLCGNSRYWSGLLPLLITAIFVCRREPANEKSEKAFNLTAAFFSFALLLSCLSGINTDYEARLPEQNNESWLVAQNLKHLGIRPNDRICLLGFRRGDFGKHYYFARLVGAKITAEIPDEKTFWELPNEQREKIIATLKNTGVRAIVEYPWSYDPPIKPPAPWQWMQLGNCYARML